MLANVKKEISEESGSGEVFEGDVVLPLGLQNSFR